MNSQKEIVNWYRSQASICKKDSLPESRANYIKLALKARKASIN